MRSLLALAVVLTLFAGCTAGGSREKADNGPTPAKPGNNTTEVRTYRVHLLPDGRASLDAPNATSPGRSPLRMRDQSPIHATAGFAAKANGTTVLVGLTATVWIETKQAASTAPPVPGNYGCQWLLYLNSFMACARSEPGVPPLPDGTSNVTVQFRLPPGGAKVGPELSFFVTGALLSPKDDPSAWVLSGSRIRDSFFDLTFKGSGAGNFTLA